MRTIDMQTWPRRDHFKLFNALRHPYFGLTANVDLTAFYPVVKQHGYSLTVAIVYTLSRAANDIPEFRYRIRDGNVVEHEVVHPSFTLLVDDDTFSFVTVDYYADFPQFADRTAEMIAYVKENPSVKDEGDRDDLLFLTAIPWVTFTNFMHPIIDFCDSVPCFAWGKFIEEGAAIKLPLNLQVHHAIMDGVHVGKFFTKVESYLSQPEALLG